MDIPRNINEEFAEVERMNSKINLFLNECEQEQSCGKTGLILYQSAEDLFINAQSKCIALAESIAAEINRIENESERQERQPID